RLGNSGLKVSKIILGCMSYGTPEWWSWVLPEEESIKHIKAAYDAGINTFDTVNAYSNGLSEVILGKAIKQHKLPRDEIVVMKKMYAVVRRNYNEPFRLEGGEDELGYVNQHGLSRKHIFESVKHSLERLQLDYIDLLQCHRFDKETPIAETMQALHDIIQAGYLTPFTSMQNHYSMMFPTLKLFGVGSIPWSPLARGLLTRPLAAQTKRGETDWLINDYGKDQGTEEIVNRVEKLAKEKGISMAQVALAWVMSRDGVTAPIVGTTSLENLYDLLGGIHVTLTEDEIKQLDEPYLPQCILGNA
ncbi:NADP-dependent oxidoreductase domain-containing protein, partial [Crucibulum laeve]